MENAKEFENLLNSTNETLIGVGNPNAKILIIACEPSIPEENHCQIEREILNNKLQWQTILSNPQKMDEWIHSYTLENNPCKDLGCGIPNYNPYYPYYRQKYKVSPKNGGTSRSWYFYQKLIDTIYGVTIRHDYIDFFNNCFTVDLSAANAPNHNRRNLTKTTQSVKERINHLFPHSFFQSFPIVIMCCGQYVHDFGIRPDKLFDINFIGDIGKNGDWINYHYTKKSGHKLLLHTKHLTARGLKVNDYINQIANICIRFRDENQIDLFK